MTKNKLLLSLLLVTMLSTSGCSRSVIRQNLGVKAPAPDEFMIESGRKGLVIPEEGLNKLPSPQKEIKKTLQAYDADESRKTLYGDEITPSKITGTEGIESAIIEKAQAERVKANVRVTVEKDYKERSSIFGTAPGGIMESIVDPFGHNRVSPDTVDGDKENKRIRKAIAKGEKVDPKKVAIKEGND